MCKYPEECKHQEWTVCPSCGGKGEFEPPFFSKDDRPVQCGVCFGEGQVCVKRSEAYRRLLQRRRKKDA